MRGHLVVRLSLITSAALLTSSCTGGSIPRPAPASLSPAAAREVHVGGTFRSAIEDFQFTDAFDPTGESSRLGMALLSQLLVRTVVTYRHVAGPSGVVPVPDLATDTGRVSPDGLTYTFTLKDGIRFGPPVPRAITSFDVEYAFRRMESAPLEAQYGNLYDGLIEGMNGPMASIPRDISGIETPDARTVVFHLTHPAGDFLHRLALPAAGPMPHEVAGCFAEAGDYGRDLVSSGPYMVGGEVGRLPCRYLQPAPGFQPTRELRLVRNPDYDPSTDDRHVREEYPDVIDISIETNSDAILRDIDQGRLESTLGTIGASDPSPPDLHNLTPHWEPLNGSTYLSMNVLSPPFDDVHVRRAVNLALDRTAIFGALGGSMKGSPTAHVFPPWFVNSANPGSSQQVGDLSRAKREMALSSYDSNRDGVCDVAVCKKIYLMAPFTPPEVNAVPVLQQDLLRIGIVLKLFETDGPPPIYPLQGVVRYRVPVALNRATEPIYPEASAIARMLHSSAISCIAQTNFSEVGISEAQARGCGVLKRWRAVRDHIPSLDVSINSCEALSGSARSRCWADFDHYVMTEVVPWAPLRFPDALIVSGRTLTRFEYDQAFGTISLCHVAVWPGSRT